MIRYFDASALVKRYVQEAGGTAVRRLLSAGSPATSRLSEVEVASALVRRCREGAFPRRERDQALAALRKDLAAMHVVELVPEISARTYALLTRHPLRANDAVQLASCIHLQERLGRPVPLVVFDQRLAEAARAEGLDVVG